MGLDHHSLRETRPHRELLSRLEIEGRIVVDLGVGHNEITDLILERRPARLIECDDSVDCEGAEIMTRDISSVSLLPENAVVISHPPLEHFLHVLDVLDQSKVRDVVLMVEESKEADLLARGFEVAFRLDGDAFEPPLGQAFVVATRWLTQPRR